MVNQDSYINRLKSRVITGIMLKVKSLMRKGKGMTTKYDKVDRGREMRLNKAERFHEHNLHFQCQNGFSSS